MHIDYITPYDRYLVIQIWKFEVNIGIDLKRWVLGIDFTGGLWIHLMLFSIFIDNEGEK